MTLYSCVYAVATFTLITGLLMFNTSTVLVFITVSLLLWLSTRRPSGLPPGPPLLPLVGNIFSMDADITVTFSKLRRQYGDIFSVYIFNQPVIVLNGYSIIKEALVKNADVFSHRPPSFLTDHFSKGKGLVFSTGSIWREHRKFSMSTLKEFGMGKTILEDTIQEELSFFLQAIHECVDTDFDCSRTLNNAVANVISSLVSGKRFEYTDPLFVKFLKCLDENVRNLHTANVLNFLPVVRHLPGDLFKFKQTLRNVSIIDKEIIRPFIYINTDNDDSSVTNFTSAYIKAMKHRHQQGQKTTMSDENLEKCLSDLFIAGSETTTTALRWGLAYFLNYPEVQEKCFKEIQEHIGQSRRPSIKDKINLPYVEATVAEILRCADIVPTNLPHSVSRDVEFRGYTFPEGITVLPMLSSVLKEPDVWGDPENFRPDRFLDTAVRFQKMNEHIAFSLGHRACLGEALARMELFLFTASMIQQFEFRPAGGMCPSLKRLPGIVTHPQQFKMKAIPRTK
ncbi:cytochrome P450 2C23-like [Haliotis rubra]|uniref:cytochrome P450 2C23-like n=1 Tax=Haliotis rubra TaxID=36100 RepID=UPI001EE56D4D|nr:cytochrome P450 2C23-like [Haliotis rubra]